VLDVDIGEEFCRRKFLFFRREGFFIKGWSWVWSWSGWGFMGWEGFVFYYI
jgi:hypothetical protein